MRQSSMNKLARIIASLALIAGCGGSKAKPETGADQIRPKAEVAQAAPQPRGPSGPTCKSMCEHAVECVQARLPSGASGAKAEQIAAEGFASCVTSCERDLSDDDIGCWSTTACDEIQSEQLLLADECPALKASKLDARGMAPSILKQAREMKPYLLSPGDPISIRDEVTGIRWYFADLPLEVRYPELFSSDTNAADEFEARAAQKKVKAAAEARLLEEQRLVLYATYHAAIPMSLEYNFDEEWWDLTLDLPKVEQDGKPALPTKLWLATRIPMELDRAAKLKDKVKKLKYIEFELTGYHPRLDLDDEPKFIIETLRYCDGNPDYLKSRCSAWDERGPFDMYANEPEDLDRVLSLPMPPKSCKNTFGCEFLGRCELDEEGVCRATTNEMCRRSKRCKVAGKCSAVNGACLATDHATCKKIKRGSLEPAFNRAVGGRCIYDREFDG